MKKKKKENKMKKTKNNLAYIISSFVKKNRPKDNHSGAL